MLHNIPATSSSSEETLDSFEEIEIESAIRAPIETEHDRKACQEAWVGDDKLESYNGYIYSQQGINIKLAGKLLAGIDLSGKSLGQAQFQWADLKNAKFCKSELRQVNFHAATLLDADFTDVTTLFVDLSETYAIGAVFNSAKLGAVDFQSAYMQSAQFIKANLPHILGMHANFYGANFNGASLVEAKLDNANLSYANLKNANLTNARLLKTNFADADLDKTKLKGAQFFPPANDLNEETLKEYLDCYAGFYIKPETREINKSLPVLIRAMREDFIHKIRMKFLGAGALSVENLVNMAVAHPLFATHKKPSTYRLNNFFTEDAEQNAIFTKSQRAFRDCYKDLVKQQARNGR